MFHFCFVLFFFSFQVISEKLLILSRTESSNYLFDCTRAHGKELQWNREKNNNKRITKKNQFVSNRRMIWYRLRYVQSAQRHILVAMQFFFFFNFCFVDKQLLEWMRIRKIAYEEVLCMRARKQRMNARYRKWTE